MKSFIQAGLLVFAAMVGFSAASAEAGCFETYGCYDDYDHCYDHHDCYDVYDDCYEEHYHVVPVRKHIIHKPVILHHDHFDSWGCGFEGEMPW